MNKELFLILHNIRSAYNVGSIFRTADSVGVKKIYLTGYTPCPFVYKNKSLHQTKAEKMLAKTALGAHAYVEWENRGDIFELMQELKKDGAKIVALEQSENSQDYRDFSVDSSIALIAGNEPSGIEKEVLGECDGIIEIPMRGKKKSLNVSVAVGVAAYELTRDVD
ncbi:MAG: RNA methyltransferase [Candidatus Moranbacteria bacterium]|nr:RNA methyltransferase [Candidatus Moranbacteria bacterium]